MGLLLGASALAGGFYDQRWWALVGIAALAALMVSLVTLDSIPALPVLLGPGALAVLAGVQKLSTTWAESTSRATAEANRTAALAALLWLLLLIARDRRGRTGLIAGLTAGALLVAVVDLARLFGDPDTGLFLVGRITEPLGYVNGQAAAFAIAIWPLLAAAESVRSRLAAAAALGAAWLLLAMVVLTQSRGAFVGVVAAALAVVAIVPGRPRRVAALALLALATAAAWTTLNAVRDSAPPATGLPTADAAHDAAFAIVVGAFAVTTGWAALHALAPHLPSGLARRPQVGLLAVTVVSITVGFGATLFGGSAVAALEDRWDSFRSLEQVPAASRLTSGGGNRYDYWRVAVDQFREAPLRGVGAGNYTTTYFRDRRTSEDIRQPHSLVLQTLGETGLLGGLALALVVVAVVLAVVRARTSALRPGGDRLLTVACIGILTYWSVHASVDWLHLLPGIAGCALAALAVLAGQAAWPDRAPTPRSGGRARAAAFVAATVATALLAVGWLGDRHLRAARAALPSDPAHALDEARKARKYDSRSVEALIVIAAARARADDYAGARAALLRAQELEPSNFIPPALLGDIASRRGDAAAARRAYARALRLNPRDPDLRASAGQAR